MWLDRFTVRNLEIIYPSHPDGVALADCLDRTTLNEQDSGLQQQCLLLKSQRLKLVTKQFIPFLKIQHYDLSLTSLNRVTLSNVHQKQFWQNQP